MMRFRSVDSSPLVRCLSLLLFVLWLAACGGEISSNSGIEVISAGHGERAEASEGEPLESMQLLRGHLVIGHEVRSFKPCGSEQDLWVRDKTGGELSRVYTDLTSGVYQELYAVVLGEVGPRPSDGFGADYDGSIAVTSLRHAAPESHACGEDLSGVEMRAFGNEPFWRVDVRPAEILLSELGAEDRLFSSSASFKTREDGLRQFRGTAGTEPGQPAGDVIVVTIDEHPCRDSMSGAYFSFAARVVVDGRELVGCARQGW